MKEISGTVEWITHTGGFFGVRGDDGVDYYPVDGLPAQARINGIRIRAKAKKANSMSIHMWGTPVKLTEVFVS